MAPPQKVKQAPSGCADVATGKVPPPRKAPPAGCADLATKAVYVPASTATPK